MPLPQTHLSDSTPMGANVVDGGATFRVWAPAAHAVHVLGEFNQWQPGEAWLLERRERGHWTGFVANLKDGDRYLFHVTGDTGAGEKRDPYARELTPEWPNSKCVLRDPSRYQWRSSHYRTPRHDDFVLYQLHVGAFFGPRLSQRPAKFLDAALQVGHLAHLGVNAVQLLPIVEFQTMFSMGYNGTDYFSPEMDYGVHDEGELQTYVDRVSPLFIGRGAAPLTIDECRGAMAQFKVLVDLLHLYGIAVVLDVVYNHAGGDFDPKSIYFFDRQRDDSLYFTKQGWAGGLVFAFWKEEVRQFLIDNARYWLGEHRLDGLRYDEVSVIDHEGGEWGWRFCQDLTRSVRAFKPEALQNAEYWPVNTWITRPVHESGAGFDATQHDGLRDTIRKAVAQASRGVEAPVEMDAVAEALRLRYFEPWQAVTCVENHDIVSDKDGIGRGPRLPALADGNDHRSPWARGRTRAALGLLLTAPGIPMLFMGQEILENERWSDDREPWNLISWEWLALGERTAADFVRFTRDAIALRHAHRALRSGKVNVHHVHNDNRVLAFHRWLEWEGGDVVVVASFNDAPLFDYRIGFPHGGEWREVFNSDVYEHFPNANVEGNGGRVIADGGALHGFANSAALTIPANGVIAFAR